MSKRKRKNKNRNSSAANARRRAAEHRSDGAPTTLKLPPDVEFLKLKTNKPMKVDILNYLVGKGNPWADEDSLHYERTYFQHKNIGVENKKYICPLKTAKKPCPICEYRSRLMKKRNPSDSERDLIDNLKPQEMQLFNAIDLKEEEPVVRILNVSNWCFGAQLDGEINDSEEDDGYENFANLEGGFTLKLGVDDEKGKGFTYPKVNRISFKSRREDYEEDFLDELHCLDDLLIILDYDALNKIFLQGGAEEEEDDDDDDFEEKKSRKKKSSKKSKKSKKKEEDDDDDFEDFEEAEEDEFEEGEDAGEDELDEEFEEDAGEDEFEDDFEEEEEEEPRKKKSSKKSKKSSKKSKKSKKKNVEEDDDDFEDFEEAEEDEFEEFEDDIPFDEDFDEDFEEEEPRKKKSSKKSKKSSKRSTKKKTKKSSKKKRKK
jgi:hypothetical protein